MLFTGIGDVGSWVYTVFDRGLFMVGFIGAVMMIWVIIISIVGILVMFLSVIFGFGIIVLALSTLLICVLTLLRWVWRE